MNRIIIYGGLVASLLLIGISASGAEIVGIKDSSECSQMVGDKADLFSALADLNSQTAQKYFQPEKNRFLFCMKPSDLNPKVKINAVAILSNSSQIPVIIYNLTVDSSAASVGQSLLSVTGPILLQNLTATNLRGPIVMNGAASMKESTLSCDTTAGNVYANPILELKGSNERVNKLTITNCKSGISVAGFGNILTNVVITKNEMMADAIDTGVILGGDNIITSALPDKSSIGGTIKVTGGNVIIAKSILAGDPAVQIAKGLTGVKVTQNKYPFKTNTPVTYADPIDIKDHTLFDQAWVSAELSDVDPTNYAKRLVGKLMDQNSTATDLEFYLYDAASGGEIFEYFLSCPIGTTSNEICFSDKSGDNEVCIHKGEKIFDCSKESLGKDFQVPLDSFVRLLTNTPTASVMSEKIAIKPKITIVAIAESTVTNGGENAPEAPSNPTGDDDPKIPEPTDTGENANGSAQGNGATSDGFALDGGTPSGYTAGASPMGSCTLSTVGADQGQTASALVWLLALLPLPLMIPFRNSKKDDE